jgi:Phosphate transport (Pho88)
MGGLHLYLKFNPPLMIQAIMGLKNLFDAKLVTIYIFGKPAEGDLKRPFKAPPSLFGGEHLVFGVFVSSNVLVGASGPQTDNAAIVEAEKRVGSKKDD